MVIVLQRVQKASVSVDNAVINSIGQGFLLLVGVHVSDTTAEADYLAQKCAEIRIFNDADGKMNRDIRDCGGQALVVSQFTLLADCRKGRRPSYIQAAPPDKARSLFDYFVSRLETFIPVVRTGIFGAAMDVALINDGPVTISLSRMPAPALSGAEDSL